MRTTKKTTTPSEPGVWFTGETSQGDFIYQVICKPQGPVNQNALELFYQWREFARPEKSLQVLLRIYFNCLTAGQTSSAPADQEELMFLMMLLADMMVVDVDEIRKDRDQLLEESLS